MSELAGPKFLGFDMDHEVIYAKVEREHLRELPRREHPLSAEDLQAAANVAAKELPALPEGQAIEVAKLVAPPASASTPGEEPRAEAPTPRIKPQQPAAPPQPSTQPQAEVQPESPTLPAPHTQQPLEKPAPEPQLAQPKPWPMPPALRPQSPPVQPAPEPHPVPRPRPTPAPQPQPLPVQPAPEPQPAPKPPTPPAPRPQPPLVQLAPEPQPAPQPRPTLPALQPQPPLAQSAAASSSQVEAQQEEQQLQQLQRQVSEAVQKQRLLEGLAARQAVYKKAAEQAERDARASTPGKQEPGDEEEPCKAEESSGGETIECESDVEEESDRPAAALSEGQGSFRRQGLPVRVFVDRIGDVYRHVDGRHLMVEKLAEILQERRFAMARASTPGRAFVVKNNWVILARPLQEMVMNNLFEHWRKGEGQPYDQKIVDQQMAKTPQQHQRKLKGYFKTYCDQVFGGQLWYKMLIALGDVPPESVQAANDVVRLRIWETSGREAGTASRPQCPDNIFGCCCSYRCCCCCFATGASVVGGSHRSQKSEVRVGRLLQTQAHGAHAPRLPIARRPRSPCLDAGREGRGRVGEASSEAAQGGEGQDAAAAEDAVLEQVRGGPSEVGGGGPRGPGVANEGGRGEDGLRVPLRRLQRRLAARADEDSCQHFRGDSLPHPLRARLREGGGRQRGAE